MPPSTLIERVDHVSAFVSPAGPRTWADLGDLVAEAVHRVVETGQPPREVVPAMLATDDLTADVAHQLIATGLRKLVADALPDTARPDGERPAEADDVSERVTGRAFSIRRPSVARDVFDILLEGADGRVKALGAFGLADCQRFAQRARTLSLAWRRRCTAMETAAAELAAAGSSTIASLPSARLAVVRSALQEAWR